MSKLTKISGGILCAAFLLFFASVPAKAASLENVANYDNCSPTFYRDITGDGKEDKVTISTAMDQNDMFVKSTQIFINEKEALTITKNSGGYYYVSANYIKMSKSKVFLQIIGHGDNDWSAINAIYRYDKKSGKLKRVLELTNGINSAGDVVKVTSKDIQVEHSYQPLETGWVNWKYTYVFKKGKFKLKKNTASVRSSLTGSNFGDGYDKYFRKHKFKAAKTLTFYTSTSQKKKAFTAKKGSVLKLNKIKVSGKKVYIQFKLGKKTGWKKVCNEYQKVYSGENHTGWFCGVAGRLAG